MSVNNADGLDSDLDEPKKKKYKFGDVTRKVKTGLKDKVQKRKDKIKNKK